MGVHPVVSSLLLHHIDCRDNSIHLFLFPPNKIDHFRMGKYQYDRKTYAQVWSSLWQFSAKKDKHDQASCVTIWLLLCVSIQRRRHGKRYRWFDPQKFTGSNFGCLDEMSTEACLAFWQFSNDQSQNDWNMIFGLDINWGGLQCSTFWAPYKS